MATDSAKTAAVLQPDAALAKANFFRAHNTLHGFEVLNMSADSKTLVVAFIWRWVVVADEEMRQYNHQIKVPCAREFRRGESAVCQRELNEAMELPEGTIRADDFIGHDYITIPMHLRARIPELVNKARTLNYSLSMKTALKSRYRPGGPPFSIDNSERLALEDFQESTRMWADSFLMFSRKDLLCDPYLWSSAAGKRFAHELQRLFRTHSRSDFTYKEEPLVLADGGAAGMPNPLIDYPLVVPSDLERAAAPLIQGLSALAQLQPQPLLSSALPPQPVAPPAPPSAPRPSEPPQRPEPPPSNKRAAAQQDASGGGSSNKCVRVVIPDNSDEEDTCMICLSAVPDTLVLPCEHRVVCRTCSEGLRTTPDNRKCVRCRRPITDVIWDGGEEHKV